MYCYATVPLSPQTSSINPFIVTSPQNSSSSFNSFIVADTSTPSAANFATQQLIPNTGHAYSLPQGLSAGSLSLCATQSGAGLVTSLDAVSGGNSDRPTSQYIGPQYTLLPADHIYIAAGNKRTFDDLLLTHQPMTSLPLMTSSNGSADQHISMLLQQQQVNPSLDAAASSEAKKAKFDGQQIELGLEQQLSVHQQQQQLQLQVLCKPSRVIHFRGVPGDITEREILQLGLPFGHMTNVVLAKKKNQALLEMMELSSAQAMVNYYCERPAQIRGRSVYVQFSNHDQLKTETADTREQNSVGDQLTTAQMTQPLINQDGGQPKNVLRVIVENLFYPVTIDILKQIFSRYGHVQKIVTFNKNNTFQALVQFSDPIAAQTAKMTLNGQYIFHGCCQLRIDYSKLLALNVRYNNDKSRDYTDPTLPAGDFPALSYNGQPVSYATGTLAPTYATTVIPGFGPATVAYCSASPGQGLSFVTGSALPYNTQGLIPAAVRMTGVRMPTPLASQHSPVLLVTNLNTEKVSPDALFTLFGVYGDVIRVKVMFNKKENALVQYADSNQAQIGLIHLDKVKLWDKELKVSPSKHTVVQMPKDGQPDSGLTKDYTNSPLHRFKKLYSKNYNNIYPPSPTLHLSNIPPSTTEEQLVDAFSRHGSIVAFKFFETDHKMALMQMSSTEEAVSCLIELHNHQLAETSHLRVSFSKATISPTMHPCSPRVEDDESQPTETVE